MERILTLPMAVDRRLANALAVLFFCLLTALGAYIHVPLPFTPVPLTMQTLMVLLSAGMLGRRAAVSQALYLILGMAGLPLFAGAAGGWARLLGPTGGYLAGFVLTAYLVGWAMKRKSRRLAVILAVMTLGSLGTLAMGAGWLAVLLRLDFARALELGIFPFLPGDLLKAGLASLMVWGWKRRLSLAS